MSKIFSSDENHLGSLEIHIKKRERERRFSLRALVIVTVEMWSMENLLYFFIIFVTLMPDALNRSILQTGSKIFSTASIVTVLRGVPVLQVLRLSF